MIKVIVVDDQVILRESIKFMVEQDTEIEVIACAGNGKEAAELCDTLSPDLVLMDIMMPICDGVEGTRLIKLTNKDIRVIILTTFSDDELISNALKNGADGYVLKDVKPEELILAIKSAAKGLGIIHHNVFDAVVKQFNSVNTSDEALNIKNELNTSFDLTDRETSIIRLIVDGKNNKEIASILFITEGSVKNTISAILNKLVLKDRTQLAVFAVKNNIV